MIRVRFAPSPTGFLHIGGARTALFNWLFARHHQGKFILRIEDTDKARSEKTYLNQILEDLRWLGLNWDEGPYFQSQRSRLYRQYAQKLIKQERAYREGEAIILKVGPEQFEFVDLIRGPIKFMPGTFKDQVLIKSDGTPTYNFACVLDDHDMQITHIIRGEDHISNTPKQMAVYRALGFELPAFAHITLMVAQDRSRLSKRKGARPLSYYREQGYLPRALFNFLALLGWSLGARREIASPEEIVQEFSLERVLKTAAAFDQEKLEWMNGQYIQGLDAAELSELIIPFLSRQGHLPKQVSRDWLCTAIELLKPRIKKLSDFSELADFLFQEKINFTAEARQFLLKQAKTKEIFSKLIAALEKVEPFEVQAIEGACRRLIAKEGISSGELIHPARVALTGKRVGPGLFESMAVLGKEKVLQRLKSAISLKL